MRRVREKERDCGRGGKSLGVDRHRRREEGDGKGRQKHSALRNDQPLPGQVGTPSLSHWRTFCPNLTAGPCQPCCPKVRDSLENAVQVFFKMLQYFLKLLNFLNLENGLKRILTTRLNYSMMTLFFIIVKEFNTHQQYTRI